MVLFNQGHSYLATLEYREKKSRTLGYSSTALHNYFVNSTASRVSKRTSNISSIAKNTKKRLVFHQNEIPLYDVAYSFRVLPQSKWFLAAFARDIWSRINTRLPPRLYLASFSKNRLHRKNIKLYGEAKGSASWVTNVGNEYGAILRSVSRLLSLTSL